MKDLSKQGKQELLSCIIDAINDGRIEGLDSTDVHHVVFNADYFIIGYYQAEEWLKSNYGVFNAICKIQEYEKDYFGEVTTDISSSEKVVNMLVYILGEELLNECNTLQNNWNEEMTAELCEELKEEIKTLD